MFFFRVHLRKPVQTMYSILLTIYICDEWICISVYVLQITQMGWKNDRSPYGSAHTNTQRQTYNKFTFSGATNGNFRSDQRFAGWLK